MPRVFRQRLLFAALLSLVVLPSKAANIDAGEKLFKRCAACHTIEQGGSSKVGPNLWGIVGAPVAANEAYARKYSKAMKAHGGIWSPERLDAFLKKPKAEVKKTKMAFAGLKKDAARADLIAFLNAQSDEPLSLEAAKDTAVETEEHDESEFGILVTERGAEETFIYCTACHSERIVAQQGLSKKDWIELLEWMVDEQEMDVIEEPDYTLVVEYLAKNYGVDRPNFPKN
ncbi:cytochrome c family protein [Hoeflea sp. TYP-13]|uniref:cytochrome c family protein n=1 Tax=Hoeflea sp. TYP-13 TaxID=3230023 RepID=UPI0034C642E2